MCWRQVHTNLHAAFKCDALKLAMIKNEHLAQRLFDVRAHNFCCCPVHKKASVHSSTRHQMPLTASSHALDVVCHTWLKARAALPRARCMIASASSSQGRICSGSSHHWYKVAWVESEAPSGCSCGGWQRGRRTLWHCTDGLLWFGCNATLGRI